jgi:hypothetical protein
MAKTPFAKNLPYCAKPFFLACSFLRYKGGVYTLLLTYAQDKAILVTSPPPKAGRVRLSRRPSPG